MRGRGRSRWLGLGMVGLLACEPGSRRLADGGADAAARGSPALASRVEVAKDTFKQDGFLDYLSAQHEKEIRQLVRAAPILSFLSWKPRPREPQLLHPDTLLVATRDRMEAQGLKNDGLIPRKNALLPGTEYVALAYIDHAEPAMNEPAPVIPSKLDRKKLTWALLALLLERLEPRGAAARTLGGGARP